jgi:transposase-like protein
MKYRKWDPKTKAKIVLESLQNNQPLSELCNNYQISQSQYFNWLKEFQSKSHKAFDSARKSKKEHRLMNENKKLKQIIAELSIELKKTELELGEGADL